ncbi:HNH endonuclease [Corynebacterium cystitidis]|nr:HNH endonuclease [Corynebacterium cystitidis]
MPNGQYPRNAQYAGKTFDVVGDGPRAVQARAEGFTEVNFRSDGSIDLDPHIYHPDGVTSGEQWVPVNSGNPAQDIRIADQQAGISNSYRRADGNPTGNALTWHHDNITRTNPVSGATEGRMILVPWSLHSAVGHNGGASTWTMGYF